MSRIITNARGSLHRKQKRKPRRDTATFKFAPNDLASLLRGLYHRVARQLDVDPSYVSRVARGERRSKKIEDALRRELNKIVNYINKRRRAKRKAVSKKL